MDEKRGLGKDNKLPWRIPQELRHFAKLTSTTEDPNKQNAVIMGRNSWESIPAKFRPLPGRFNIVLTRRSDYETPPDVPTAQSLEQAVQIADRPEIENLYVVGGGHVYREAILHPNCSGMYLTEVQGEFNCDTFFPRFNEDQYLPYETSETFEGEGHRFKFVKYRRI